MKTANWKQVYATAVRLARKHPDSRDSDIVWLTCLQYRGFRMPMNRIQLAGYVRMMRKEWRWLDEQRRQAKSRPRLHLVVDNGDRSTTAE
jgi:hypothetical protein